MLMEKMIRNILKYNMETNIKYWFASNYIQKTEQIFKGRKMNYSKMDYFVQEGR
jgi:hypothetical protein